MLGFLNKQLSLVLSTTRNYHKAHAFVKKSSFEFPESFLTQKRNEMKRQSPFGFGGLGETVYRRTYAREKEDWVDTCSRVIKGTMNMYTSRLVKVSGHESVDSGFIQAFAQEMFESMFHIRFLPPGRGLWGCGSPITEERGLYAALNNCGFVSTKDMKKDPVAPFVFLMDASMLGVGVGFDTLGAGKISIVDKNRSFGSAPYVIPDSREGWVNALKLLLKHYFIPGHKHPRFDYSLIRPAGAPIRAFGGVSGGPEPLIHALTEIESILEARRGQLITTTNIVDIMNIIGKCIVSGNVRRTAEIAFGDPNSEEFMDLKNYAKNPHRSSFGWTSNNSIMATLGMDYRPIVDRIFDNGEPGLFWLKNAQDYSRMMDPPDYKDKNAKGSNPCITGDTVIFTTRGPKRAASLLGIPFDVVVDNEIHNSPSGMFLTGYKNVYRLKTKEGYHLDVTRDHKIWVASKVTNSSRKTVWKRAKNLIHGDKIILNNSRLFKGWDGKGTRDEGWLVGALVGSNRFNHKEKTAGFRFSGDTRLFLYGEMMEKITTCPNLWHLFPDGATHMIPDSNDLSFTAHELWDLCTSFGVYGIQNINDSLCYDTSSEFQKGFISGVFDTTISTNDLLTDRSNLKIRLESACQSSMIQKMLLNFGVVSSVCMKREYVNIDACVDDDVTSSVEYSGTFRVLLIKHDNIPEFMTKVGFLNFIATKLIEDNLKAHRRRPLKEKFVATFESLDFIKAEIVYDCTVDNIHRFGANGMIIHNCLEQTLESYELCCLVETFPERHDDLDEFLRTLELAFFYAKIVTLGEAHWPQTAEVMNRNRRIGTSMSGITQFIAAHGLDTLKRWCVDGYAHLKVFDSILSSQLRIPESNKITSIKPSGSVSLVAGATPGMHYPISSKYIRRVRFPSNSPLLTPLQKAGYFIEDAKDGISGSTKVVEFPISTSDDAIPNVEDVSIWQQLALAAFLQEYWADNSVSCTVTFDPEKTSQEELVFALDVYQYKLKGISFLPNVKSGAYPQMPYEPIDNATYHRLIEGIKPIEWDDASKEFVEVKEKTFCDNDSCDLPLKQ